MRLSKIGFILCLFLHAAVAFGQDFVQDRDYLKIANKIRAKGPVADLLSKNPNGVQLAFFFSFGCPSCARFDPYFEQWLGTQKDPKFTLYRFPVQFEPMWQDFAKLYYVMQSLQPKKDLNAQIFKTVSSEGINLSTEENMRNFFVQQGYTEQQFNQAYNSSKVAAQIKYANDISIAYNIYETPTVIINTPTDSYMITIDLAGDSDARMIDIINYLVGDKNTKH